MYNEDTALSPSTLGYTFQNDFLALSGRFHYRNRLCRISQRRRLAAAIKDGLTAEFAQPHSLRKPRMAVTRTAGRARRGGNRHISHRSTRTGVTNLKENVTVIDASPDNLRMSFNVDFVRIRAVRRDRCWTAGLARCRIRYTSQRSTAVWTARRARAGKSAGTAETLGGSDRLSGR